MIAALGRALWNFLSLEESVVAILHEAEFQALDEARRGTAGSKESALRGLRNKLNEQGAPADVIDEVDRGIEAFSAARSEWRNAISHAHPFTAGYAEDGTYLPGLSYTPPRGVHRTIARNAADLHQIAHRIEDAIDPLSDAREAVRVYVGYSE